MTWSDWLPRLPASVIGGEQRLAIGTHAAGDGLDVRQGHRRPAVSALGGAEAATARPAASPSRAPSAAVARALRLSTSGVLSGADRGGRRQRPT
jgi:hypothetical protein